MLSPEAIESLLTSLSSNTPSDKPALREAQIDFFCVSVRGDGPNVVSERMGVVYDLACAHGGTVLYQISGVVVIAYGLFEFEDAPEQDPGKLGESLCAKLGDKVKIVHGKAVGHVGLLGNFTFSFIVPGFLESLALLSSIPYGECREFKP